MTSPPEPAAVASVADDAPDNVALRLLRGGGARAGAYVAANGLAALTAAFLTVHLGTVGFGEYTRVMAMAAVLLVVADSGTTNLAARELAAGDPRRDVASIVGLRLGLASLGAAVMLLVAVLSGWRPELVAGTAVAGAGVVAAVTLTSYLVPSYAALELERVALNEFLYPAGASVLVLVAVAGDAGIGVILAAQLAAAAPLAVSAFRRARGRMPRRPSFHPGRVAPLVAESASFALAVSVATLILNVTQLSLGTVADKETQGIAGLAWRVMLAGIAAAPVLVNGAIPALSAAAGEDERLATATDRVVGLACMAGGVIAIGAFVGAPTIVHVLADASYSDATTILREYAVVAPLMYVAAALGIVLLALSVHRPLAWANLAGLLVAAFAPALLVPALGGEALAVGGLLAVGVLLIGQFIAWRSMRRAVRLPWRTVGLALLAAAAACLAGWALPIPNVPQVMAALVLYVALLGALRVLPPEATGLVRRFAGR